MELTKKIMTGLVPISPKAPGQTDNGSRKASRTSLFACLSMAIVRDGVIGDQTIVLGENLSATGVSFLSSIELAQGQEFIIWLPTTNGSQMAIYCQVDWRSALNRSSYCVGAHFTRICTKEELANSVQGSTPVNIPA